jgi:predicted DNA-binding transcriptional regulator AlpA
MKDEDELVPMKQVLEEVGASRTTLWRAMHSGIDGFPKPTMRGGRVFWKRSEIAKVDAGLGAYKGRVQFDTKRRQQQAHVQLDRRIKLRAPKKRKPVEEPPTLCDGLVQGELFRTPK